jgi:hypothetical protein
MGHFGVRGIATDWTQSPQAKREGIWCTYSRRVNLCKAPLDEKLIDQTKIGIFHLCIMQLRKTGTFLQLLEAGWRKQPEFVP